MVADTDTLEHMAAASARGAAPGAAQAIDNGRRLFAQPCTFLAGVAEDWQLPDLAAPEVAFAGRSNVGKSSLVNALTGRKTLARTSLTPGRTRQINFYDLGGRLILVDLPGYGYARAGKAEVRRWTALVRRYLRGRARLRRVCLLIDARLGAKDSDRAVMDELDAAAVSYQVMLTKADKVEPAALAAMRQRMLRELAQRGAAHPEIVTTSAVSGQGIDDLRAALASLAAPSAPT